MPVFPWAKSHQFSYEELPQNGSFWCFFLSQKQSPREFCENSIKSLLRTQQLLFRLMSLKYKFNTTSVQKITNTLHVKGNSQMVSNHPSSIRLFVPHPARTRACVPLPSPR
jgi:hypothetical protein